MVPAFLDVFPKPPFSINAPIINANNANPTIAITRKDFCLIFDKTAIF